MPRFFSPTYENPRRFHPDDRPYMQRLRARQRSTDIGINVFILKDGTVTPFQPQDNDSIARWLKGGSLERISTAEATLLASAGYATSILPDPPGGYAGGYAVGY